MSASKDFWSNRPVFVIAEAGSNWRMGTPQRDMEMARALIDVAAEAGANAVKFQTFRPETIYAPGAGANDSLAEHGVEQSMDELFADLAMPYEMLAPLAEYAKAQGLSFMSTAFSPADFGAVDPLVEVHKIASYEITHLRLIELAASTGKPTLMSTGATTLAQPGSTTSTRGAMSARARSRSIAVANQCVRSNSPPSKRCSGSAAVSRTRTP